MFSGLMAKITGVLSVIVGIMAMMLQIKSNKIENLEEENAAHEKKGEIIDDMRLAEVNAEEKKDERIKNIDGTNWRDNI